MKALTKMLGTLAVGLSLTIGTASSQSFETPPASECTANGVIGSVDLLNGQRVFMCQNGEWRFLYECRFDASGYCVIP
ncbi:hypothetical protein MNO14_06655 [Luteimonas sp. S4-F44]|uniref:hypothetical protein n=1 Tax=Luteimonas sp. S4-F44 TaxID=2925842 RepID=UPI001F52FC9F|nr:hypothetical protein [Luteimonas sp. S4-F44]UNK43735.1 hypothetical protein MNO14_06655 [Luteimonas sp. S4-F44]